MFLSYVLIALCFIYSVKFVLDLCSDNRSGKPHSFFEIETEKNRPAYAED